MAGGRNWLPQGEAIGGDIAPNVFINVSTSDNKFATAGAGGQAVAVTDSTTRGPDAASDGIHASIGETVRVQDGNVKTVLAAGVIAVGAGVESDAAGNAVVLAAGIQLGVAIQLGAAGTEIEVLTRF